MMELQNMCPKFYTYNKTMKHSEQSIYILMKTEASISIQWDNLFLYNADMLHRLLVYVTVHK